MAHPKLSGSNYYNRVLKTVQDVIYLTVATVKGKLNF